ncbi:ergosterol biosynthesis ERG4/ERG24 family-domain-containing protein [Zopfochytrium polystomum]|nr:ergosterol biosynthesis ERG4/ERG24 family-domain-containing protein [Zopfochytrium polystomum]
MADLIACTLQIVEVYAVVWALHMILPARTVAGYCTHFNTVNPAPLPYRLNGPLVLFTTLGLYVALAAAGVKSPTFLAEHFFELWGVAAALGVALSAAVVLTNHGAEPPSKPGAVDESSYLRCLTVDMVSEPPSSSSGSYSSSKGAYTVKTLPPRDLLHPRPFLITFWNGRVFNPRLFGVDIKMYLYLAGAVLLELNILSLAALHVRQSYGITTAATVYVATFSWFVVEYLYFEEVHLYTYDLFAEKIGLKLTFGCLGFYPFAYCLGAAALAHSPIPDAASDVQPATAALFTVLFFLGWTFTRGSNLQKFYFKRNPTAPTFLFGLIPQRAVRPGSRILASGFWALSRHINYLGEVVQSVAVTLPCVVAVGAAGAAAGTHWAWAWVAWIYPLYYVGLFLGRERDDNAVCRKKYGDAWMEYERKTPWRIVPYVY